VSALGALPAPVAELIAGHEVEPISIGRSAATTARVRRAEGDWILKIQPVDPLDTSVVGEAERMRWLVDHVAVPEVVAAGADDGVEWLLATARPGSDATRPEHGMDAERLVRTLADGLRLFHERVPVAGCPFDATTDTAIAAALARVDAGRVDETDFQPLHLGMSATELFEVMVASRPEGDDELVVLHGDYCVPNVILDEGAITGYVDLGRSGIGERHRDVAIAARSIADNFGGHAVGLFVDAYGLERPDLARLDFFVMLDEFF
jgi:aminoglycoside 3'-phosphotransferase II